MEYVWQGILLEFMSTLEVGTTAGFRQIILNHDLEINILCKLGKCTRYMVLKQLMNV